jgi:hypothetical protein
VTTENNRRFPRTRLRAEVKLAHPAVGEQRAHTRDISEGGAFVLSDGITASPQLGDIIEVQVQGLPGEAAPVVPMRVVRIDHDGIALEFLHDEGA